MSEDFEASRRNISERRRLERERRRRARRIRRIVVFSIELVLLLIVITCGVILYLLDPIHRYEIDPNDIYTNPVDGTTEAEEPQTQISTGAEGETYHVTLPTPTSKPLEVETSDEVDYPFGDEDYTTMVVFGMDGRADVDSYTSGSNSDVIIIVSINNKTHEVRLASVYRDTIMKLYSKKEFNKANYAICNYGVLEAINTLNYNLDLHITHSICISWAAAVEAIDALGGVDIELKKEFYEIYSSDAKTVVPYLNGLISEIVENTGIDSMAIPKEYFSGPWHADGVQAVAYMRLRYTDSDFNRTERQREIIGKLMEKAKTSSLDSLLKAWNGIGSNMAVSLSQEDILGLLWHIMDYSIVDTTGYPFNLYDGADYSQSSGLLWTVFPIDSVENVKELHAFLYNDEDYEPTSTIYEIDKELRKLGKFDENWEPLFETRSYD